MSGRQLQTAWNRANMCPHSWIKTPVCMSGQVSQLLVMRRRCHTDHTYCRLLPNLFPRPLEHTHIRTDRHTARFHLHSETRRLFPTHPTCFGARPSFRSVTTSWKARRWRGSGFCGNSCWQEFFEVTQNFLDLRFWSEKRNRILSCYSRLRLELNTVCRSLTHRHDSHKCQLKIRNTEMWKRAWGLLYSIIHKPILMDLSPICLHLSHEQPVVQSLMYVIPQRHLLKTLKCMNFTWKRVFVTLQVLTYLQLTRYT